MDIIFCSNCDLLSLYCRIYLRLRKCTKLLSTDFSPIHLQFHFHLLRVYYFFFVQNTVNVSFLLFQIYLQPSCADLRISKTCMLSAYLIFNGNILILCMMNFCFYLINPPNSIKNVWTLFFVGLIWFIVYLYKY